MDSANGGKVVGSYVVRPLTIRIIEGICIEPVARDPSPGRSPLEEHLPESARGCCILWELERVSNDGDW